MKHNEFMKIVQEYIEEGNCHLNQDREILLDFKNSGGTQKTAKKLLEELAFQLSKNETLQDRVYDMLDIVTDWCSPEARVWK